MQLEGSKTDSKYILWIYFPLSFMIEKQFENYRRVELLLSKISLSTLSFYSVTGGVEVGNTVSTPDPALSRVTHHTSVTAGAGLDCVKPTLSVTSNSLHMFGDI